MPSSLPRAPVLMGLVIGLAMGSAVPAQAADWARFRGPNGTGVDDSGALPAELGADRNMVWRTEVPSGYSSPIVAAGRVFLTGLDGEQLVTLALDVDTGRILWRAAAPRARRERVDDRNHSASPSVATDGKAVFVFFADFGLLAYGLDGEELWRLPLGPFRNTYGMGASPVVIGERVILAADQQSGSFLLAVAKKTGEVAWRVERPEATSGHSTPIFYRPPTGIEQVILPGSFFLTAYSAADGERLWWVRGLSFEMKSTPVLDDGVLYINGFGSEFNELGKEQSVRPFAAVLAEHDGDGDGQLSAAEQPDELSKGWFPYNDLDGDGALAAAEWEYFRAALDTRNSIMAIRMPAAGERGDLTATHVRWRYHRSVPQLPSPLLYRGVLYMINDRGVVTAFAPHSGEVLAQGRIAGAVDSYYASPVAGDGKVYFAGRSGKLAVLPAGGNLEPLAVNDLDDEIVATPAIAGGRLLVRTGSALWAFATSSR